MVKAYHTADKEQYDKRKNYANTGGPLLENLNIGDKGMEL